MTSRSETKIVGLQLHQVQDGEADEKEEYNKEDGAKCKGERIYGEDGLKGKFHQSRPTLLARIIHELATPTVDMNAQRLWCYMLYMS